jgi:bifunctional lysine-specific demethylase and histidyl-hydroxylase NO66
LQLFSFDWLLHPIPASVFFRTYWEAEPLLISREEPGYFADLPGLDAVDELITATTSGPARSMDDGRMVKTDRRGVVSERRIRLGSNGIPDIQDIYRAYHDGYSVVVNQVHRRSATVALLCRTLESALHHPIGVNLYLTPRGSQCFRPHVDNHDVFILQLHGVKEWHISSPSNDLPLAWTKHGLAGSLEEFREFTLGPGDMLYVPRGFPHEAMTSSSSSLHLTVGVHVYRWINLVSEALLILADERIGFGTALPPKFLDAPLDTRAAQFANDLALAITDSSLLERAKVRLSSRLLGAGKAAGRGHFRSIDAIAGLTSESALVRAPGLLCRVRSTSKETMIEFATNHVSGPLLLEPALTFIAEREQFAVFELPGELSTEDKIDLVNRLISEGLLLCTDHKHGGKV